MQNKSKKKIIVLGAGNFGTCLAQHLATIGHDVTIWARRAEIATGINEKNCNPYYLNTIKLSPKLRAISDLSDQNIKNSEVIVLAIPCQFIRQQLHKLTKVISKEQLLVLAAKGIEVDSLKLPEQIVAETLGQKIAANTVSLSGPSFAIEVATQQPTAVSAGSHCTARAELAQSVFHAPFFRVYTSSDPLGLEVAGALKNVIAIASGACYGLGYQANSRAAVVTRGLAEITRIGVAMGADPFTFTSLGGVGDLFLTCSSEKSRNFTVGNRLGRGETLAHIIKNLGSIAEGITTTKSAKQLTDQLNVEAPIINSVYNVLYRQEPITDVVDRLLNREAKREVDV